MTSLELYQKVTIDLNERLSSQKKKEFLSSLSLKAALEGYLVGVLTLNELQLVLSIRYLLSESVTESKRCSAIRGKKWEVTLATTS